MQGTPSLEITRGGLLTLRKGTSVILGRPVMLERGQLLVDAPDGLDVATVVTSVSTKGVSRVGQSLASSVRVYEGEARVTSLGRTLAVPALRQVTIPARGLVPQRAAPTTWRRDDMWDVRYLGLVIDLTDQLDAQGRGFAVQAGTASTDDLAALFPGLAKDAFSRAASNRSSGEALVGAGISSAGKRAPNRVFGLRDDGASWGIVAIEQVSGDPSRAVSLVRQAISAWLSRVGVEPQPRLAAGPIASPGSGAPLPSPFAPVRAPSPTTPPPSTTTPPPPGGPTTTTPPPTTTPIVTVPPPPVTAPGPVPTTVPPLDEVVGIIADGTTGLTGGG